MSRSVTHLVVTDNFAGVERYVTTVAAETAARGWSVRVLGGRAEEMRALLPDRVEWAPAPTMATAASALARRPASLVHAHMTKAEAVATLSPRVRRIVATRHFASTRGRNRIVTAGTGLLARRLSAEIAISETVRRASGDPTMEVLLNAVPLPSTERRPEKTVVVAQRWEKEKRTLDAVEAFEQSGLATQGWRLVLHGSGADEPALRRAAADSPSAAAIEVAGFARDMDDVMARAGIVLATADREPFGLVVAEAMAAGTPVVASASGGHLESVGQVEHAYLFPVGDTQAAAQQLRRLASDPAARTAYGADLRSWAATRLSVERHVDDLLALYERVVT